MALTTENRLSNKIFKALQHAKINVARTVNLGHDLNNPFVMHPDIEVFDPSFDHIWFIIQFDRNDPDKFKINYNAYFQDFLQNPNDLTCFHDYVEHPSNVREYQEYAKRVKAVVKPFIVKCKTLKKVKKTTHL